MVNIIKRDFILAVKAVIVNENKILLLKRSRKEMEGSYINKLEVWDLPGGGVKFFESCEKALFREVEEETKINVEIVRAVGVHDVIRNKIHLAVFTYLCQYISGEVVLSSEHFDYCWLTLKEMEEQNVPKWMIRNCSIAFNDLQDHK